MSLFARKRDDSVLIELLKGFQQAALDAVRASGAQATRLDAHERVCTERYGELIKDSAAKHAENKAAIKSLGKLIWGLVISVTSSVILLLLACLGWIVAYWIEHHP